MPTRFTQTARSYLLELHARSGGSGSVRDGDIERLAALLEQTAAEERRACWQIADDVMRLCGSHAAERIANEIEVRNMADAAG